MWHLAVVEDSPVEGLYRFGPGVREPGPGAREQRWRRRGKRAREVNEEVWTAAVAAIEAAPVILLGSDPAVRRYQARRRRMDVTGSRGARRYLLLHDGACLILPGPPAGSSR
jgi:hypothetical protein